MRNKANNLANAISGETFKKLFLLHIVGNFQSGVYGKLRLHKIVYMIERKIEIKPFEFRKYHYGQYSESLDEAQDQLLSMGYLIAIPLRTEFPDRSGNLFELADKGMRTYYSLFIDKINPNLKKKIRETIRACSILKLLVNTICYKEVKPKLPPKYCVSGDRLQKSSMIWKNLPP